MDFVIGSSLPATIYTLSYVGNAYSKRPVDALSYPLFAIVMPLLFGVGNVLVNRYTNTRVGFMVFGVVFGLVLSIIGLSLNLPVDLFRINNQFVVLPMAAALYALIWGIPIYELNRYIK